MSLLTIIRSACRRIGLTPPNVVASSTDATTGLLYELAQEEGRALSKYGDWKILRKEKTFTTVAAETQTDTPIPSDWDAFIDNTFWNRTRRIRLYGPLNPDDWQRYKAGSTFPITNCFTIRGTSWLIRPIPAAGDTIYYEYRSNQWCQSSGGTAQSAWAADSDTGILSEDLMADGIIWRYKQDRGLEWQSFYDKYIYNVDQALAKDKPHRIVDMKNGGPPVRTPGLVIPEGAWPV